MSHFILIFFKSQHPFDLLYSYILLTILNRRIDQYPLDIPILFSIYWIVEIRINHRFHIILSCHVSLERGHGEYEYVRDQMDMLVVISNGYNNNIILIVVVIFSFGSHSLPRSRREKERARIQIEWGAMKSKSRISIGFSRDINRFLRTAI